MPAPTALGNIRTGTPDTTSGHKLVELDAREDSTLKIPGGVMLSDMLANGPTAHRASGGVDTATDMSSAGFGTSTEVTNNRGAIAVWVEFDTAGATCTLTPVFYDDAGTPAPMALGPLLSFAASAKRVSAAGNYMSEVQLIDTNGFKRFKFYKDTISGGNVTVHAIPL